MHPTVGTISRARNEGEHLSTVLKKRGNSGKSAVVTAILDADDAAASLPNRFDIF
jgi:hypothetical protein